MAHQPISCVSFAKERRESTHASVIVATRTRRGFAFDMQSAAKPSWLSKPANSSTGFTPTIRASRPARELIHAVATTDFRDRQTASPHTQRPISKTGKAAASKTHAPDQGKAGKTPEIQFDTWRE